MSEFERQVVSVAQERRRSPRLDFNCPVIINGIKGVHTITDLSMGGVFIELSAGTTLHHSQKLHLVVKLPTENYSLHIKAQVEYQGKRGVGCQFLELAERDSEAFRHCFNVYRDMLPVR